MDSDKTGAIKWSKRMGKETAQRKDNENIKKIEESSTDRQNVKL